MLKLPRAVLLCAAIIAGFSSVARAQLLTANTITSGTNTVHNSYLTGEILTNGTSFTQTFTDISSIDTFTLRFVSGSNALGASVTVALAFTEWSGSNATSLISSVYLTLAAPSSWALDSYYYLDAAIDMSPIASSLVPGNTYGFSVIGTAVTASNDIRIGGEDGSAGYANGSVFSHSGVTAFADLTSDGGPADTLTDFAFIGNSAAAAYTPFAPVPEASTIAVLFAGLFVGGLVFKRVRDRRQQALAVTA